MSGFKPNSVPTTLQPIHLRTCQLNSLFSPPKFLLGIILLPQKKKKKKLKNASVEGTAPVRRAARALGQEVVALPALVQKTKQRHQTEGLWESQSRADVGPIFSSSSGHCPASQRGLVGSRLALQTLEGSKGTRGARIRNVKGGGTRVRLFYQKERPFLKHRPPRNC